MGDERAGTKESAVGTSAALVTRWCHEVTVHDSHRWSDSGHAFVCPGIPLSDSQSSTSILEQFVLAADWYRRCLEDVIDRRPVCGLDEARHGYDAAFDAAQELLREEGRWTTT